MHHLALLNAEQGALVGDWQGAESHYREAISMAVRTGHLHDAALFNEGYADFLRRENPPIGVREDDASFQINEAIKFYKDWGVCRRSKACSV